MLCPQLHENGLDIYNERSAELMPRLPWKVSDYPNAKTQYPYRGKAPRNCVEPSCHLGLFRKVSDFFHGKMKHNASMIQVVRLESSFM